MIRVADAELPDGGDKAGRPMLLAVLNARLENAAGGAPAAMQMKALPGLLELGETDLAGAALWLRRVAIQTGYAINNDPRRVGPLPDPSPIEFYSWTLAHKFVSGCPPYEYGALVICCPPCLMSMVPQLALMAAVMTERQFGPAAIMAPAYIDKGGQLPAPPGTTVRVMS